jgi:hypothetical protein
VVLELKILKFLDEDLNLYLEHSSYVRAFLTFISYSFHTINVRAFYQPFFIYKTVDVFTMRNDSFPLLVLFPSSHFLKLTLDLWGPCMGPDLIGF